MMSAGLAGASKKIALNGPTIGNKGQGLSYSIGRLSSLNYDRSYGKNRDVVFRICQFGGIGRGGSHRC